MRFWFDIHAHLDDEVFQEDLFGVLQRAEKNGVKIVITHGISLASSREILKMAQDYPSIYVALGIHPQEVKGDKIDFSSLENLLSYPKVVAVGEVGLDFYWDRQYQREQEETFYAQIEIAERYGLPLVVHSRGAEEQVLKILNAFQIHIPVIWHCFSGNQELLEKILKQGFYVSLNGIVTYPKAVELRKAIASIPLNRVFLETDAPYLPPQGRRGQRNEPAFLVETAHFLSTFWKVDIWSLQDCLFSNLQQVFGNRLGNELGEEELSKVERGYTI
ncbi:MAG: TatD family hydrolase [Candidatus Caldatribacteriaceae bacterium]